MGTGKQYDEEFMKQAIKPAKEIGIRLLQIERLLTAKSCILKKATGIITAASGQMMTV